MIRRTIKLLLVALIASFALGSFAEAAPAKKTVKRAKHSSRVTAGSTARKPAAKKPAAKKRKAAAAKAAAKKPAAKRKPSTKPR